MAHTLSAATRKLVARFRRQRPLRAGSLLITLFGDAVAPHGGAISLGSLIQLTQPFGVGERLVRTSVARLAQDGWLASEREGRTSEYRLTDVGKRRFAEATRRIYASSPERWAGSWTLLLVPFNGTARDKVREELRWLGFGQVSQGLLAHPTRSVPEVRAQLADLESSTAGIAIFQAQSGDLDADRRLAASGWDLNELSRDYAAFVRSFAPVLDALRTQGAVESSEVEPAGEEAERAFVIRTLLVHEYRKIHLRDPLLPRDLLPANWIGNEAYELCRALYGQVFDAAERHFASIASRTRGTLPALSRETWSRFGGLRPTVKR
jgi:phenylacetic acid degradation operon negative regulatory protein